MVRIVFFLISIVIMFFPLLFSYSDKQKIMKSCNNKAVIEIFDGYFRGYRNYFIDFKGNFKKAEFFSDYKKFYDLWVNKIFKNEKYFAKSAIKKENIIKANRVFYLNKDYVLFSPRIVYDIKTKFLKGWDFNFTSKQAYGKGKYFEVKDKNIYAKNIIYFIKVDK
jgi:hypothetical protein